MVRLSRAIVVIMVVLALHRDSTAVDVELTTEADEFVINEGDFLEIKCISRESIFFIYPVSDDGITTSPHNKSETFENGYHTYVFQRPETVYGDTGLYGCPNASLEITSHPDFRSHQSLVYVYVQSDTNVFVQVDTIATVVALVGDSAIVPCRPTSPNFTVQLLITNEAATNPSFNPRIGFTLTNLTVKDSAMIECVIDHDDRVHKINYHLHVIRKHVLNKPNIDENTLRHVTRGQTLYVNCTVDVEADIQYDFKWSILQQNSRITTRSYERRLSSIKRVTKELVIVDVKDEDEGWYECEIRSQFDTKRSKKFIRVHDPENKFINLTTDDTSTHYQRQEGDTVQWIVHVDAYPPVNYTWLNTKGQEIMGDWVYADRAKYAVNTTSISTILRINNLAIGDMGVYSLQATNHDMTKMLNFTLDVLVKPLLMLKVQPYYAPDQEVEISCDVATFPSPNVTWSFTYCPNFPSHQDAYTVELTDTTKNETDTRFTSTVKMTIKMSGQLTCSACNIIGCESQTEAILVSDGKGDFGIIEPKEPVVDGDDVELICAASVYNHTNHFEWKDTNYTPIEQNNRLEIVETKTRFTYRSILKIKNVREEDSMVYICINKEEMRYFLKIHSGEEPEITETNLYENETVIDLTTHERKPIILKCFAKGMPKPQVSWYKDDTKLKIGEQYECLHDKQELHIHYLRENDGGKFSCYVENRFGVLTRSVTIIVEVNNLPKELMILIVILLITVVILVICFTIKVRREKIMRKELMEAGLMHFEEGAVECLNPDLTVDDQAELLPYDKKWEFPREKLKFGKQLGSGEFGVVMKAEAERICEYEPVTTVAVKMVRRTTVPTCVRALASELKIMVHLGKHLNVVNLLGACTKNISKRELLVIVEYCRYGNLRDYLLRHRSNFINQIDPVTGKFDSSIGLDLLTRQASVGSNNSRIRYVALSFSRSLSQSSTTGSANYQPSSVDSQGISMSPEGCVHSNNSSQPEWWSNYGGDYKEHNLKPICTQDLLSWAFQVARGMEYVSQRKVLHGDLAARNILLAEDNVVKICDFGLARTMYKDNNYRKKGDGVLPLKWMAIESIRDGIFSTQSDVWSFGIVLWEFFTLAKTPYPGIEPGNLYSKLTQEGHRMEQPEYATSEVYNIMRQCWEAKPSLRPSFTELVNRIGDLLEESVRARYISLNDPYIDMNTKLLEGGKDYLQMLSAPDHTTLSSPISNHDDSAYLCMSPSSPGDESGIFSPRPAQQRSHFEFPPPTSDSEDAIELSPMLKNQEDDDPYLKPINVHERRAEFVRQMQAKKNQSIDRPIDRDSGYCNAPRNLQLIDLNEKNEKDSKNTDNNAKLSNNGNAIKKEFIPAIIRTQDNYVNIPKQKSDMRLDMPDGFSNPSYVMMTNRERDQMKV